LDKHYERFDRMDAPLTNHDQRFDNILGYRKEIDHALDASPQSISASTEKLPPNSGGPQGATPLVRGPAPTMLGTRRRTPLPLRLRQAEVALGLDRTVASAAETPRDQISSTIKNPS
jgi:hypothetical protein